jgi:hypothetical protein
MAAPKLFVTHSNLDEISNKALMPGASGPIPAFASACSLLESKCRNQKDHEQLFDSSGAFQFDI